MQQKETIRDLCQPTEHGYYTLQINADAPPVRLFLTPKLLDEADTGLWAQIKNAALMPGTQEIVITPDAHVSGGAVPVGCVIATHDTLLHSPVGGDIGCGIMCFRSDVSDTKGRDEKLRRKFSEEVMKRVGLGVGVRGSVSVTRKGFQEIIRTGAVALGYNRQASERDFLPVDDDWDAPTKAVDKGIGQLCSLGAATILLNCSTTKTANCGLWCIPAHAALAISWPITTSKSPERNKSGGESRRIWKARISAWIPPHFAGYKNAVAAGGNFAIANRLLIWEQVGTAFRRVFGQEPELVYEISHNLAQYETTPSGKAAWVHRKGATRAFPAGHPDLAGTPWQETGHPVLVPGSMGDHSYVLMPRPGVANSLFSVNHGCGRRMSRGESRQKLTQSGVNNQMKRLGVMVNGGSGDVPIDESPNVYKPARDVLDALLAADLATVAYTLSPLASIKGVD